MRNRSRNYRGVLRGGSGAIYAGPGAPPVVYDPAVLSLTGWWRDFALVSNSWAGTASAGTSGNAINDLEDAGQPPTAGTLNGHPIADFDGTDDVLWCDLTATPDTFFGVKAVWGWILIYIDAVTGTDHIFASNSSSEAPIGIKITGTTVTFQINNNAAAVTRTIAVGEWQLLTFRYDGTNVQIGVNEAPGASGGASTTAYSTNVSSLSSNGLRFGNGVVGAGPINCKMADIGLSDVAIDDTAYGNIKSYCNSRYALSLP